MKAAINIWSFEPGLGIDRILNMASKAGFEGIELALNEEGELSLSSSEKELKEIKKKAEDKGLEIVSLASGLGFTYSFSSNNKELRQKGIDIARRQIELANILGTDTILLIPGNVGITFMPASEIVDYDLAYDRALEALNRLKDHAKAYEVTIGIENVWNKFLLSPLEARDLIDKINSDYVKFYLDVGNLMPYAYPTQWIKILNNRIQMVHIKDFRCQVGNLNGFVDLLTGDVPFKEVTKALRAVNYDSWLVAEIGIYREYSDQVLYNTRNSMRRIINEG